MRLAGFVLFLLMLVVFAHYMVVAVILSLLDMILSVGIEALVIGLFLLLLIREVAR